MKIWINLALSVPSAEAKNMLKMPDTGKWSWFRMNSLKTAKMTFEMDGQFAQMIINALHEKADRCESPHVAAMYRVAAKQVQDTKVAFHAETLRQMAPWYGIEVKGHAEAAHDRLQFQPFRPMAADRIRREHQLR